MANPFANESTRAVDKTPPALVKLKSKETIIKVSVPTAGGGFTNVEMPLKLYEYLRDLQEGNLDWRSNQDNYLRPTLWKSPLAISIAKQEQPERYADPINNAFNRIMFGGAGLYRAAANGALEGLSGTIRKWIPKMSFRSAYGNTAAATAGDAAMIAVPTGYEANDLIQNGPTVENVLGTGMGLFGLGYEAIPTMVEGYNTIRNTVRPMIVGAKMRTMPLEGGKTSLSKTPMRNLNTHSRLESYGVEKKAPLSVSTMWDRAAIAVQNKPFIEAYNQWNRFGYPLVPKEMASNTPKLEAFVKGQLNRHNTFSRGVLVMPSEKLALESLLGRKLTDNEFLEIAATTPRMEGNIGLPGLWISPRTDYTNIYGGGKTALVRRPFKLGSDRMKWFEEASFNVLHNPRGEEYTEIVAPWNFKPVIGWHGRPEGMISIVPESELLSPFKMELIDFVKGSTHMNHRTSLNSNPFFTKGNNHFDPLLGGWIIDTYRKGGKLNEKD